MANRLPSDFKRDDLGVALKWLRHQSHYTQEQVVEASGKAFSKVFYAQCEQGNRYPSQPVLSTMLKALGSTPDQLQALLEEKPWDYNLALEDNKPTLRARNLRRGTKLSKATGSEPLYPSKSLTQYQAFSASLPSSLKASSRMANLDNLASSSNLLGSLPEPMGGAEPITNAEPLMELELSSPTTYPHFEETTPISDQEYRDNLAKAQAYLETLSPEELQQFVEVFPGLDSEVSSDLLKVLKKLSS